MEAVGGVFSEGIDLKKERLIGAVIVGTGLPMVCVEQEVLRGYFEEKEEAGFDFAYQYPGMVAELEKPTVELRKNILRNKIHRDGLQFPRTRIPPPHNIASWHIENFAAHPIP